MNFEFTEEQKMLRDMVRRFAEEQVKPRAKEIDEKCEIPQEIIKQLAELGLMGIHVPEEYGGSGLNYVLCNSGGGAITCLCFDGCFGVGSYFFGGGSYIEIWY